MDGPAFIITMLKWIRTSRLSIKNSLSGHAFVRRHSRFSARVFCGSGVTIPRFQSRGQPGSGHMLDEMPLGSEGW